MTDRTHIREIGATGYVGDGAQALHDDGTWKVPSGGGGSGTPATPTLRSTSSGYSASGVTFNITIPATAAVGDLLVLSIAMNNTVTAAPTGWILIANTAGGYHNSTLMVKRCRTGDPGSTVTITQAGGSEAADWYCSAISGAGQVADGVVAQATTGVASIKAPLLRAKSGALLLVHVSVRGTSGPTLSCSGDAGSFTQIASRADANPSALLTATATGLDYLTMTTSVTPGGISGTAICIAG